jgi:glucose 1-dehydrogenase
MRPAQDLRGACAVVTGAASGIGRALADTLAARGARLALIDVHAEGLERAARELGAMAIAADVRDEAAIADAAARIEADLGPVELLFSNAGVATVGPACETPLADVRWVLDVNTIGSIIVARQFVPRMVAARRGRIAFTASLAGLLGAPGMAAYSASKFAVVGFAESLRIEVEPSGITVTVICPGYVRTGLHAATRYHHEGFRRFLDRAPSLLGMTPAQVAAAAVDATCAGQPVVTLGPERLFLWLARLAPRAYATVASRGGRALGLLGREAGS